MGEIIILNVDKLGRMWTATIRCFAIENHKINTNKYNKKDLNNGNANTYSEIDVSLVPSDLFPILLSVISNDELFRLSPNAPDRSCCLNLFVKWLQG